jgi:hypothetical protein
MAGRDTYLNLLREGNLDFTHQHGRLNTGNAAGDSDLDIESLVFADGSRAVRIKAPGQAPGWTRWAALEPPSVLVPDFA